MLLSLTSGRTATSLPLIISFSIKKAGITAIYSLLKMAARNIQIVLVCIIGLMGMGLIPFGKDKLMQQSGSINVLWQNLCCGRSSGLDGNPLFLIYSGVATISRRTGNISEASRMPLEFCPVCKQTSKPSWTGSQNRSCCSSSTVNSGCSF